MGKEIKMIVKLINHAEQICLRDGTNHAIDFLRPKLKQYPENYKIPSYLSFLSCRAKKWDDAQHYAEIAIMLNPDDTIAQRSLAHSLFELRHFRQAHEEANKLYGMTKSTEDFELLRTTKRMVEKRARKRI